MTSARSPAIGCTETERLLTVHLLSRHGTCSASPATTTSLALACRHRPQEVRSHRSPPAGQTLPLARLSRLPWGFLRPLRLQERELEMSAARDTYLQEYLTSDIAILLSHRLQKDSPRARPKARAPRRSSTTGDRRARVPKIVLRVVIAIVIGTITILAAGAAEAGEDCSAVRHREAMGKTGSAQLSPSLPHAEDEHAMRAYLWLDTSGSFVPSSFQYLD